MARVPSSVDTRKRLRDMLAGGTGESETSAFVRQAVRLMIEEALEAAVSERLGRGYYERGSQTAAEEAPRGYRNGVRVGRLKSAEGVIEYGVPQVRGLEGWQSEIRAALGGKSEELERLAVEMYARGLSMRDIEAAFTATDGRCLLSRSAASRVCEALWADYQEFARRDLSEIEVAYLFIDGVAERLHLGQPREAVLAAWAITMTGTKVLLGLQPGTKEDTACCSDFLRDRKARGLADPVLVVTDGAPGLIRAVEECLPRALRQRCLAPKLRNLETKVPAERWREVKARALAAYHASSPKTAELAAEEFRHTFANELPSGVKCFDDDFAACITYLRLPVAHRRATRTTNLLERLFLEERRRSHTIPHAFGERAVLKLRYAALQRASGTWQRVAITDFERKQLLTLSEELDREFNEKHRLAQPASRSPISSKRGT
ncbi:MAG: IS256 family transposase [Nitrospira sp.]|nr:IS256 family transposase [Nitrospira sp.]